MKLVKDNPEMPQKLEPDDNKRKQLAELMLEYPAKEEQDDQEQIEEKRLFTCLLCRGKYNDISGKLNHLVSSERCRNVPQKENFENKCQ